MSNKILGMISETPVHLGIGQMDGAIDLPIARESATNIPHAPGSSVKGALLETARERAVTNYKKIFGGDGNQSQNGEEKTESAAGTVQFGEMRLLLLPVRSLNGFFKWVTCPYIIERYFKDRKRVLNISSEHIADIAREHVLCAGEGPVYLEERLFQIDANDEVLGQIAGQLEAAIPCELARAKLQERLAIVSNEDFAWFVEHAIPVVARNVLQDSDEARKENDDIPTKISKNLWYEEHLPADTVMTLTLVNRSGGNDTDQLVKDLFFDGEQAQPYFRIGGNETTGQGWFQVGDIQITKKV